MDFTTYMEVSPYRPFPWDARVVSLTLPKKCESSKPKQTSYAEVLKQTRALKEEPKVEKLAIKKQKEKRKKRKRKQAKEESKSRVVVRRPAQPSQTQTQPQSQTQQVTHQNEEVKQQTPALLESKTETKTETEPKDVEESPVIETAPKSELNEMSWADL